MNKTILISLGTVLLIGNGVYLYPKYQAMNTDSLLAQHPLITQSTDDIGRMIQSKVGVLISPASFTEPLSEHQASFEAFNAFLRSDYLFRVKIWDTDYRVIWSDVSDLIGKRFTDNDEVREILASGDRKIEIKRNIQKDSGKTELFTEGFYNNYFEFYYPIKDENGQVVGIIETYQVITGSLAQIRSEFYKTAVWSIGSSIVVFLLIFFLGRRINRNENII